MSRMESTSVFLQLLFFVTVTLLAAQAEAVDGQVRPKVYSCPKDDGIKHTSPNGVTFQLLCGRGTTANRIDDTKKFSQAACADFCSEHPECQSADWNADTKNCARFSETGVNTWFPLEKREKPSEKPDPTPLDPPNCPKSPDMIVEAKNSAKCPENNGQVYVTNEGSYFKLKCDHQNWDTVITSTTAVDLQECIELCGLTMGCESVAFYNYQCDLYPTGENNLVLCTGAGTAAHHDAAFHEITIKCSTTCPGAHGQTFEAHGVQFRMSCCKRHGVVTFASEQMPSFTECMKTCAMVTSCASVDYHERTGTCYYGKHFGEPTVQVAGWASAYSIGTQGGQPAPRSEL
ncbi:hypothetical protein BGX38DRAFT_1207628 [Terfezia claveryi]|nr:hypothetical protein BGX38DRAFT_1207628 [Terfezia claveryi]